MQNKLMELVDSQYVRSDIPQFKAGDTVKVHYRVKEGEKERIQIYEGTVIKLNRGGVSKTFTVRKMSSNVGVERIFPINSPMIAKVDLVRVGKVRRAKLYYIRTKKGKDAKIKEKI